MLKFSRKNESGRSMVEMLGVLAIVGVLSVMGIAGYTVAMNNHRANEALNQASRYAMLISAQRQASSGAVGGPTTDNNGSYTFTLDTSNTNQIVMTVNVPASVKAKLVAMNVAGVDITEDGANVKFTFNNDLGNGPEPINVGDPCTQREEPTFTCRDVLNPTTGKKESQIYVCYGYGWDEATESPYCTDDTYEERLLCASHGLANSPDSLCSVHVWSP